MIPFFSIAIGKYLDLGGGMKKIFLILLLLVPGLVQAKAFHPEADGDLEKKMFWATSYFKPGTNVAVMNFRVWFQYPPEQVFQILIDTNRLKHWLDNFNDSRALTKQLFKNIINGNPRSHKEVVQIIGDNKISSRYNRQKGRNWTDYVYFQFNLPWPLTDRWAVQKVKVDETNFNKGNYRYDYKMHVGNFKKLEGYWELIPAPGHPGWTEFRGRYESNPGIPVPKFIMRKAAVTGLRKDVGAYRRVLNK